MSTPGDGSRGRRKGRGRGIGTGRGRVEQGEGQQRGRASGQRPGRQQLEREDSKVPETPTTTGREKSSQEEAPRPQPSPGTREVHEGRVNDSDLPALIPAEQELEPAPVHRKPPAGSVQGTRHSLHENVGRRPQEVPSGGASPLVQEPPRHTVPSGGARPLVQEPHSHIAPLGGASQLVQKPPSHTAPSGGARPLVREPPSHTAPSGGARPLVREPPSHTAPSGGARPLVREPPSHTAPSGGARPLVREPPSHTAPSGGARPLVREPPSHTAPSGGARPLVREPPSHTAPSGGASRLVQEPPSRTQPTVQLKPVPAVTDQKSPSSGPLALRGSHQLPKRPGFGTQGRQINLRANFFPVQFPDGTLYHYDVAIVPGKCPRRINRIVIEAIVSKYKKEYFNTHLPSFDGRKNLYCREELPIGDTQLDLDVTLATDEGEKERLFKVTVKLAARVDLGCLQDTLNEVSSRMSAVQALDIVFRHTPSMRYETVGRSFFSDRQSKDLGGGREVWFGYFQSLRPTMKWPFALNVDVAATAFYKAQSVLQFLCEQLRKDSRKPPTYLCDSDRVRFEKEIKGLRIEVTHLPYPRRYRVCGVSKCPASELTFPLEDQKECTVERYFLEKHKKRLGFPGLPCLHVGKKEGHVFIPLELCKIVPGQHCRKKLSDYQTSQMIRHTVQPAYEREKKILQNVEGARFNLDPRLTDLDIAVTDRMVEFTGRILPQPTLTYKQKGTTPDAKQGTWDMKGKHFHEGVEIRTWAIIVFPHPRSCHVGGHTCEVENFVSQLRRTSKELGMVIRSDPRIHYLDPRGEDVESVFHRLCSGMKGLQLIVAVLDDEKGQGSAYNKVKSVGDNLIGIATQCILAKNVRKANKTTISNLCLKINAKLGGVNTIIHPPASIFSEPVIVMGADVTHPAPGDIRKPSIAAVTASMDRYASKYRADCSIQKHRQEIIADLESMTRTLLLDFHDALRGARPRRIIFYRDGVSEGQFDDVVVNEVAAIQRACKSLQKEDYEPGITFIVVQKRHHTRLFCSNKEDAVGRGANVPPGTTVDRDITHPTDHDFYLCSHAAIQGTSRPCHYYVLWDDNHLSADDLQTLSYQLCHVFFRCNRSVSYPAPTYYAHHVAFHARALLQDWEDKHSDSASTTSSVSDDHPYASQEDMARAVKIKDEIRKNMYFA